MEGAIRRLNRGAYDRDFEPIVEATSANRRAFVNEVAFEALRIFVSAARQGSGVRISEGLIQQAAPHVRTQATLRRRDGDYVSDLSDSECADALEQLRRLTLLLFARCAPKDVWIDPPFKGCGIVDACFGDAITQSELVEVKAGDRLFRAIDIRQAITYLALNHVSGQYAIDRVVLANPRIGISRSWEVEELCFEVSGQDRARLLDQVAYALSAGDVSR